jgi:uncharacterized membrane protein YfcA
MMENIAGYFASALIGVSLGLIGGGGSIITIPVLVYLFHIEPTLATAYSLFIVGTTSVVGGVRGILLKTVNFRSALLFAIPSTLAVYLTRHFVLPLIPGNIATTGSFTLTRDIALMLFFSVIMVLAAVRMIREKQREEKEITVSRRQFAIILLQGLLVGIITGIVGAGGGFLIIPALVLLVGLPMKKAIGTSLIVIAINSLIGFVGDMHLAREIDFPFMMILSSLAVMGVFLGIYLSRFIDGKNLKSGFGWFALAMAIFIVIKELTL